MTNQPSELQLVRVQLAWYQTMYETFCEVLGLEIKRPPTIEEMMERINS